MRFAGFAEVYDALGDREQVTLRQLSLYRCMLHIVDFGHAHACTVDGQHIQSNQHLQNEFIEE